MASMKKIKGYHDLIRFPFSASYAVTAMRTCVAIVLSSLCLYFDLFSSFQCKWVLGEILKQIQFAGLPAGYINAKQVQLQMSSHGFLRTACCNHESKKEERFSTGKIHKYFQ